MDGFINPSRDLFSKDLLPPFLRDRVVFAKKGVSYFLGCWIWTGTITKGFNGGYGMCYSPVHKKSLSTHRLVYEELVGPIPKGLQLDHLCRVRRCCNPAHLEPITAKENARRRVLSTRGVQIGDNPVDSLLVDIPILDTGRAWE